MYRAAVTSWKNTIALNIPRHNSKMLERKYSNVSWPECNAHAPFHFTLLRDCGNSRLRSDEFSTEANSRIVAHVQWTFHSYSETLIRNLHKIHQSTVPWRGKVMKSLLWRSETLNHQLIQWQALLRIHQMCSDWRVFCLKRKQTWSDLWTAIRDSRRYFSFNGKFKFRVSTCPYFMW